MRKLRPQPRLVYRTIWAADLKIWYEGKVLDDDDPKATMKDAEARLSPDWTLVRLLSPILIYRGNKQ